MENKMEEEFMKEEMKRNKIIFLIIGGIALVIILGFVLYKFVFNKDVSNNDNDDIVPTLSDDVTKSDDIKENNQANKNGNTLYVYQKGYSDMAPIAFTYDCKSENCNLFTTDKGFVLFDEDKVMYREMTSYEYEQINNSDKSPNGEELEFDGFKEASSILTGASFAKSVTDECKKCNLNHYSDDSLNNVYEFDGRLYYLHENEFNTIEYFKEKNHNIFLFETIIAFDGCNIVYDYLSKQIIYVGEMYEVGIDLWEGKSIKNDDFTILYVKDAYLTYTNKFYVVFDNKYNSFNRIYENDGFIYNNHLLYFIDYSYDEDGARKEVKAIDGEGKSVSSNNFDNLLSSLFLFDKNVVFVDEDNNLKIKNIFENKIIDQLDLKIKDMYGYYIENSENGYVMYVYDKSVLENSDFNDFRIKNNISDEHYNRIDECLGEEMGDFVCDVGYKITFNNNGKFLSNDYYIYLNKEKYD